MEKQELEDLYLAMKSVRRLMEARVAGDPLTDMDDVLKIVR